MNRLKLLTMATLMALTITACDEGEAPPVDVPPPPTPVGTISGTVTIDGTGATGITATLSSGATTATGAGGTFSFAGVEAGSYTVTISGFPTDAAFPSATQAATIASDGQTVQLNFAGEYIRSSSVVGSVVAADPMMMGSDSNGDMLELRPELELRPDMLDGITVTLEGENTMAEPQSTMEGGFAFTGLRAGSYTVTISGYPEDVKFDEVSMTVEVGVGEVGMAEFEGAYIRTAAVEGRVIIEGEGLAGVTVTLTGGPGNDNYTKLTGDNGEYAFTELRPGDYQVSISGYDPDDYEFASSAHDVSVDLDETETVSFTGVLLRTSGISGRVSVEGTGLADIEVTLSGAADDTGMTDASGQYAFAGLAAGDYTVSIAGFDADAYVFGSMSTDVTVGDDDSQIANFEGAHATTASVSGMLFIDELTKNDMHDTGEAALPQAGVPVALVGPGVNDQRLSATNAEGQFMFSDLRAGPYQLIVPIGAEVAAALAANDLAYGGPATGYPFDLAVGEAKTQAVPFDITHTTINVAVTLKGGEYRGMPIPGASVTLYSDAAGETKVGSGETEASEAGVYTSIKVARSATTNNTVYMGVSADGYFMDPTAANQAVTWNSQSFVHPAMGADPPAVLNDADIVNLNVDVTVSGATKTTDYGGGEALKGWAIAVLSGSDPDSLTAVEGAPAMLDEDGNAAFTTTAAPDALPVAFAIAVAPDQADAMDGGENYAAEPATYVHTGLMLAGTQDAGTLEVAFTTQTLKVYVHHELDQVEGYTGNIIGGDERDGKGDARKVDVEIRYIDDSGRSRAFTAADSISTPKTNGDGGAWVFSNVPAGMSVIAQASKADNTDYSIMLLDEGGHADELAAFTGTDANGITGGHFGAQGGYSHTVSLCPLQDTNPQDHGDCSSFAYVSTHSVSGLIWKNQVLRSTTSANDDGFKMGPEDDEGPTWVPGSTVGLSPVEGKNIAGDEESATTTEKAVRGPGESSAGTEVLDETHEFAFNNIASGVYTVSVPDGWRARMGPKDATAMVGNALNPLVGDVSLDVTPATTTVYGYVRDTEDFPVADVTVNVNGVEAVSDIHGRYIAEYVGSEDRTIKRVKHDDMVFVETAHEGNGPTLDSMRFAANSRINQDVELSGAGTTASISGTVTASGSGAPIAGAEIKVDDAAPTNAATSGANKGKLVTGADGTYTATIKAKDLGESAAVTVSKDGLSFAPTTLSVPAHAGSAVSGINFTGFLHATISGRVKGTDGNAMGGVSVTATNVVEGGANDAVASTTNARGTFVLSVPFGTYDIEASAANHTFEYPNGRQRVSVAPGQSLDFGTIEAMWPGARGLSATRALNADDDQTADVDESDPPTYDGMIEVTFDGASMDVPDGYNAATYQVRHNGSTADGMFPTTGGEVPTAAMTAGDSPVVIPGKWTASFNSPADTAFQVQVVATAQLTTDPTDETNIVITSDPVTVDAVDPTVTGTITAVRGVRDPDDTPVDTLGVSWAATTNAMSRFRVLIEVSASNLGDASVWFVASGATQLDNERAWNLDIPAADASVTWSSLAGTEVIITRADLLKGLRVRVDARQKGVDEEAGDDVWPEDRQGTAVSVTADPDDS